MFRRKKKEEASEGAPEPREQTAELTSETAAAEAANSESSEERPTIEAAPAVAGAVGTSERETNGSPTPSVARGRGHRVQKVGTVSSDKMQKTVVVRVDRLVLHPKYRRYVRRTSKFMAHDDLGATTGDRVRIVETRPLSARKRWRVVEIVQKAAK
jgi:small subunit ribosomal protein S17